MLRKCAFLFLFAACVNVAVGVCAHGQSSGSPTAEPPPATVTFYSNRFGVMAGLGLKGVQGFQGHIFEDHQLLTYIGTGDFISFNFPGGIHDLSVDGWTSHSDKHGVHLLLYLFPGEHYFVELRTIVHPSDFIYHYGPLFGIENKTCSTAREENAEDKPVAQKHLTKEGAAVVVAEPSFPSCPSLIIPSAAQ